MGRCLLGLALAVVMACCLGAQARPAQGTEPEPTVLRPTRPVVGTSRPLPAVDKTGGCSDKRSKQQCRKWKNKGYCHPKWFVGNQQVRSLCKRTCNACTTNGGGNTSPCPDLLTWCGQWEASGYCDAKWVYENQSVRNYWCKTTCGTCNGGFNPGPTNPNPTNPTDPGTNPGGSDWQSQLLALVNQARAQVGAPALCLNSKLGAAAQAHSQDQANLQSYSHTGSDGSNPGDRITRAGYSWSAYGENVAWNYADVTAAFNGWMNSPGHRANILSASFRHMGAGRADSNGPYWTQVFGDSFSETCS